MSFSRCRRSCPRLANDRQQVALLRIEAAVGHDLGHGQDAVQRRADLVAHVGQEIALGPAGGFGVSALLQKLQLHGFALADVLADGDNPGERVVAVADRLERPRGPSEYAV